MAKNCLRRTGGYHNLCNDLRERFNKVRCLNLCMGTIGVLSKECKMFHDFLSHEVMLSDLQRQYIIRKLVGCCIRTTYYLDFALETDG